MKTKGSLEGGFLIQRELENDDEDLWMFVPNEREMRETVEEGDHVYRLDSVKYVGKTKMKVEFE